MPAIISWWSILTGRKRNRHFKKEKHVTIQQVCALAALTARKPGNASKNHIAEGDFEWIFARNCEGTEQLQNISKEQAE